MKPLGKAMKIVHEYQQNISDALDDLLLTYRFTPHQATGISPGNVIFRNGYHRNFPRMLTADNEVENARDKDLKSRLYRQNNTNFSIKCKETFLLPGKHVLVADHGRESKYDPLYQRIPYQIVSMDGDKGVILQRITDGKMDGKMVR